jgi:hypothetical protein
MRATLIGVSLLLVSTVAIASAAEPPLVVNQTLTTPENTALTVGTAALLAGDSDPQGESLFLSGATQPVHGAVAIAGTALTYSPAAGFHGTDSFLCTVADSAGESSTAIVAVVVTQTNQPPVPGASSFVTAEDVADAIPVSQLLITSIDPNGLALTVSAVSAASNGSVALAGGVVTFTPAGNFFGTASFQYTLSDGVLSAQGTALVTVLPVEHVPGAPVLHSPTEGEYVTAPDPILESSTSIDPYTDNLSYEFQIDTTFNFDTSNLRDSGLVSGLDGFVTWAPGGLTDWTVYYWRLRAFDGVGYSDWSLTDFFEDAVDAPPSAPIPLDPTDGMIVEASAVTLDLLDSTSADGAPRSYTFTLSSDSAGNDVIEVSPLIPETPTRTTWKPAKPLATGVRYFWTAQATTVSGTPGLVSTSAVFLTEAPSGGGGGCDVGDGRTGAAGFLLLLLLGATPLAARRLPARHLRRFQTVLFRGSAGR